MIKNKIIIIFIENYYREFLGKLLLSLKLNYKNYYVIITYINIFNKFYDELKKYLPDNTIFMCKSCDKISNKVYLDIFNKYNIVILDEEGGGFLENFYYINNRCHIDSLKNINKFFNWGLNENILLKNKFKGSENKFVVTGNPRFDILKYHNIFSDDIMYIKNKYKKYVLIIGFFISDLKLFDELKNKYEMLNTKQDFENFNKNIENTKKVFELYKLLVKKLCEKYKDTKFLWKMHPRTVKQVNSKESNNNSNLNDYFINFNNFILLNDYRMVEPYIICSEYVLHCNSTCGYQAYILGKKNINYKPIDNLYSSVTTKKHTSYLTGYICKNINEIFDLVDSNFKKKLIINENELEKCIHNLKKNVNSSEDILNELNKINNKNKIDNINIHEIKKILLNFEKIIFKKNEKYERFREERIIKFINIIKKNFNFNYNVKFKININAILLE